MATYDYEQLGDEQFQMLCQAVLVREFPNVQCFPVGMPDGGRDAIIQEGHLKNSVVFQVKFKKETAGQSSQEILEWLKKAVDGEIPKVERLAARGARQYVILTNISATSHLDVGRLDQFQQYLDQTLPIPSSCWWRDNLDRRLDSSYDLRLRYPALLSGSDVVRVVWEAISMGEPQGRRRAAINAYLADQYGQDSVLRFKQADLLATPLLDLFVDVPVTLSARRRKDAPVALRHAYSRAVRRNVRYRKDKTPRGLEASRPGVIATADGSVYEETVDGFLRQIQMPGARLILDPEFMDVARFILLEGAPGQGKSTLIQYIAQVHRARILEQSDDERKLDSVERRSALYLPLRLELRDLAQWLRGLNPWDPSGNRNVQHNKPTTLEGAIVGHIERYSGGVAFDVADLHQVLRSCPSILLLDALDEVADQGDRANVVAAVQEGLQRLSGNAIHPRVVVTSRPTAITDSPTFDDNEFHHMTLDAIDEALALQYAERWATVRNLDDRDKTSLFRTLREKVRSPHISELAKNTMQLTILLTLLHLRGSGLPDKRTELYNAYFDIFLDREAEKSAVVKSNRSLLVDLHRYLGFYLHAQAEKEKTSGRVGYEQLKELLSNYLASERQPADLLEPLFTGMVERFGALVARVEGLYEFDVQPLREYFAGRHLYDTAPYSPTGREMAGTKPDRFDGIAPNPYWFNVTRFFAGCFSKGELADLAERVCDLIQLPEGQKVPFHRSLAVALLKDWVFSQSPRSTELVVRTVFDERGLRWAGEGLLEADPVATPFAPLLPDGAGSAQLVEICWACLVLEEQNTERAEALCRLLVRQSDRRELSIRWFDEYRRRSPDARASWLQIGVWLRVLGLLSKPEVSELLASDGPSFCKKTTSLAASGYLFDGVDSAMARRAAVALLNCPGSRPPHLLQPAPFLVFSHIVDPDMWHSSLVRIAPMPEHVFITAASMLEKAEAVDQAIGRVFGVVADLAQDQPSTSLRPWIMVTEGLIESFGLNWTALELGVMAGAVRQSRERGRGAKRLFDNSKPLPHRIRYARSQRSNAAWWTDQYFAASDNFERGLWLLALYAWAESDVFDSHLSLMSVAMASLSADDKDRVFEAARRSDTYRIRRGHVTSCDATDPALSLELLALIYWRLDETTAAVALEQRLLPSLVGRRVANICLTQLLRPFVERGREGRPGLVNDLARVHGAGGHYRRYRRVNSHRVPALSDEMIERLWDMPAFIVVALPRTVHQRGQRARPVWQIAEQEGWFAGSGTNE